MLHPYRITRNSHSHIHPKIMSYNTGRVKTSMLMDDSNDVEVIRTRSYRKLHSSSCSLWQAVLIKQSLPRLNITGDECFDFESQQSSSFAESHLTDNQNLNYNSDTRYTSQIQHRTEDFLEDEGIVNSTNHWCHVSSPEKTTHPIALHPGEGICSDTITVPYKCFKMGVSNTIGARLSPSSWQLEPIDMLSAR